MAGPTKTLSPHRGFYPSTVSEKQRKEALAQVLAERKAQHDADEAARQRLYATPPACRTSATRSPTTTASPTKKRPRSSTRALSGEIEMAPEGDRRHFASATVALRLCIRLTRFIKYNGNLLEVLHLNGNEISRVARRLYHNCSFRTGVSLTLLFEFIRPWAVSASYWREIHHFSYRHTNRACMAENDSSSRIC